MVEALALGFRVQGLGSPETPHALNTVLPRDCDHGCDRDLRNAKVSKET